MIIEGQYIILRMLFNYDVRMALHRSQSSCWHNNASGSFFIISITFSINALNWIACSCALPTRARCVTRSR